MNSPTYCGYALLRSNLKSGSDSDIAAAVAYGKCVKFYPLGQASEQPDTTFVDAADVLFDATIAYDASSRHSTAGCRPSRGSPATRQ